MVDVNYWNRCFYVLSILNNGIDVSNYQYGFFLFVCILFSWRLCDRDIPLPWLAKPDAYTAPCRAKTARETSKTDRDKVPVGQPTGIAYFPCQAMAGGHSWRLADRKRYSCRFPIFPCRFSPHRKISVFGSVIPSKENESLTISRSILLIDLISSKTWVNLFHAN